MNDQFTGQILANKYRVESVLRGDDLGKIYRATHVSMNKPVTVKILAPALAVDESIVRRFSAEARGVSQITHPNILNVNDFGADNGAVYIVYEGAPGETVKEAVRTEGKFSFERAVNIARQIASALAAAHAAGMIHQNLSSNNIFLARTATGVETVKLAGFSAESNVRELFDENAQNENIEYLSPEQCSDTGAVDERSDIYSLGVILYEMLAGEVPFSGRTPTEIMLKSSAEPPAPLAAFRQDLPAEIEPIVLQAMAKNPEMRFHTVDEFAAALARVTGSYGEQETVVITQARDTAEPANNNIWKTAFVVLAGISLLAIGLIYATSVKQTDPATQMQTDANGQPVQPINPATGTDEQALSNLAAGVPEIIANSNMMTMPPGALVPGGDGYNPWGGSGPPPGAPIAPPGNYIMIDPNTGSPFTTDVNGIYLVPVPANTATVNANVKPSPTPRGNAVNANTAAPPASNTAPKPTPQTTPETKPSPPKTEKTPAKPAEQPKASPPAATEKRVQSGKEQDS